MDLRIYYNKIREQESKIESDFPIIVSSETQDGGRAGVKTEVPKRVAAKMIVDGLARLARGPEAGAFLAEREAAIRGAKEAAEVTKLAVNIITGSGLERLKAAADPAKE
jgi:hypothetical protein